MVSVMCPVWLSPDAHVSVSVRQDDLSELRSDDGDNECA